MKKIIYFTNAILGSLTLLGFLTIYIGLVGMFVMGCLHLIFLFCYAIQWKTLGERNKQDIRYYTYGLLALAFISIVSFVFDLEVMFLVLMICSLGMGIYFTVIINRIYKSETDESKEEILEGVLDSGLD